MKITTFPYLVCIHFNQYKLKYFTPGFTPVFDAILLYKKYVGKYVENLDEKGLVCYNIRVVYCAFLPLEGPKKCWIKSFRFIVVSLHKNVPFLPLNPGRVRRFDTMMIYAEELRRHL